MLKSDYTKGLKVVKIKLVRDGAIGKDRYITNPQEAIDIMCEELAEYDRELMCVVNLRSDMSVINMNISSIGNINSAIASPRDIFKSSILSNAAGILIFHNHPSGNLKPSKDDYNMTKRLVEAGQLLEVQVVDHIIVSSGPRKGYYSFKEHGELGLGALEAMCRNSYER
ncbi:MAG: JAB domain-containing protein [Firmicutes bacterium]|nr:JAB domain-containing protein [Bacillota bacterium]